MDRYKWSGFVVCVVFYMRFHNFLKYNRIIVRSSLANFKFLDVLDVMGSKRRVVDSSSAYFCLKHLPSVSQLVYLKVVDFAHFDWDLLFTQFAWVLPKCWVSSQRLHHRLSVFRAVSWCFREFRLKFNLWRKVVIERFWYNSYLFAYSSNFKRLSLCLLLRKECIHGFSLVISCLGALVKNWLCWKSRFSNVV